MNNSKIHIRELKAFRGVVKLEGLLNLPESAHVWCLNHLEFQSPENGDIDVFACK
jgi:hypothetical protein